MEEPLTESLLQGRGLSLGGDRRQQCGGDPGLPSIGSGLGPACLASKHPLSFPSPKCGSVQPKDAEESTSRVSVCA